MISARRIPAPFKQAQDLPSQPEDTALENEESSFFASLAKSRAFWAIAIPGIFGLGVAAAGALYLLGAMAAMSAAIVGASLLTAGFISLFALSGSDKNQTEKARVSASNTPATPAAIMPLAVSPSPTHSPRAGAAVAAAAAPSPAYPEFDVPSPSLRR